MANFISDVHVPLSGAVTYFKNLDDIQKKNEISHNGSGVLSNSNGKVHSGGVIDFVSRSCRQFPQYSMVLVSDEAIDLENIDFQVDEIIHTVEACAEAGAAAVVTTGVDLFRDKAPQVIERLKTVEEICGVRLLLNRSLGRWDEQHAALDFMGDRIWLENFMLLEDANLMVDVDIYPEQIPELYYLLQDFPNINVILGQSGFPRDLSEGGDETWRNAMAVIARLDNVHVKLGGFHLFDPDWNCATVWPVVHHLLLCFGDDRVIFGSNCNPDWSEQQYASVIDNLAAILPSQEVAEKVFHANADWLFNLEPDRKDHDFKALTHSLSTGSAP